jgi:hypothetical protein
MNYIGASFAAVGLAAVGAWVLLHEHGCWGATLLMASILVAFGTLGRTDE